MDFPLVSIIIPVFNRADIISDTLDSIVLQSYQNWECIIIDDGSTDQTVTVINEYVLNDGRFSVCKRPAEKSKGANACRNHGLSMAKGVYVVFFDSDDIMAVNCLEGRVDHFTVHNDKDLLIFSMGVFIDKTDLQIYPMRKVVNLNLKETIEDFVVGDKTPWNVCRPIFKSQLLKGKIEFNEEMQNFQDDEFNIRVLGLLNPSYLSVDLTDCYYRFDEASVKKYNNLKGKQDIVDCLHGFYSTVFFVFDEKQKEKHRKRLILKFFSLIRFYVMPQINIKGVFRTIKLFRKELGLTYKETLQFYLIIFLNKYYYNNMGYYYLTSKLKIILSK